MYILGGVFTLVWVLSLVLRAPYWGQLYPGERAELVSAEMLFFAKNWWVQSPWSLGFTMPYLPYSVESATLAARDELYNWYPPGVLVAPWLVAEVLRREPTANLLTAINLVGHLVVIGGLGFSAFLLSRCLKFAQIVAGCLAVSTAVLATFAAGPLYWFLRIYIWDIGVIPVFVLFLLLEVTCFYRSRDAIHPAAVWNGYRTAQLVLAFMGMWTEWLFFFVFAVWGPVMALRICLNRGRRAIVGAGLILLMPIFTFLAIQIWRLQSTAFDLRTEWQRTVAHFLYRAGFAGQESQLMPLGRMNLWLDKNYLGKTLGPDDWSFLASIQQAHLSRLLWRLTSMDQAELALWLSQQGWGWLAPALIGVLTVAAIAFLVTLARRGRRAGSSPIFALAWTTVLAGLPVLIHFAVFRNHAAQHEFVAAKVVVPFALYFGCVVPVAILLLLRGVASLCRAERAFPAVAALLALFVFAGAIGYAFRWNQHSETLADNFSGQIWSKDLPAYDPSLGTAIRKNTGFNDVVVSPDFAIGPLSYDLAYSMKIVEKLTESEIGERIAASCPPRSLVVVSRRDEEVPSGRVDKWKADGLFFGRYRAGPGECVD